MIVELFGPSAVGKTTFAAALTLGMREHGCPIEPVVSYRPAEQEAGQGALGGCRGAPGNPASDGSAGGCAEPGPRRV